MLELENALDQILGVISDSRSERIGLKEAYRRVLAETVFSPVNLPLFDNSAMDGYAVRAADVTTAKPDAPVELRLAGRVAAGASFSDELTRGCCIRVFTGSP